MIPRLYEASTTDFSSNGEGLLIDSHSWEIYEEENGDFTATFKYPTHGRLFNSIQRGNIVKAHANKKSKNQKFRIFSIEPNQDSMDITVKARHKTFDTVYDFIPREIVLEGKSCEFALNKIFENSLFCKNYVGESDIINCQDFSIGFVTPAEAIKGKKGSIVDTFGNGAKVIRDNSETDKIKVMTSRGTSREILLSYGKNITGFTGKEDDTDLITRIIPYAKYTPEGGTETIYRPTTFSHIDSENANDYYGIYFTKEMDFTDKLAENQIPNDEFLASCCTNYYNDNKPHFPKISYTVNFQDLSSTTLVTTGANRLYDVEIGDSLIVWHKIFNIRSEVRVVATKFDPITEEYIEVILGDLRSTLSEIIADSTTVIKGDKGDTGETGPAGADGDITSFPDTQPSKPIVNLSSGLSVIEASWTYENKIYYNYEVYASQNRGFIPNAFDLVYKGQASSYLFQAEPNQTWYFRVRGVNTHGTSSPFSDEVSTATGKISDASKWFESASIGDAQIGELKLDRGWVGRLKGNYIDARNLTVTDGNGDYTLYVDSFGLITLNVTQLTIRSKDVPTTDDIQNNVKAIIIKYYLSNSKIILEGGTWVDEAPDWTSGKYLWTKTITVLYNDNTIESEPVCLAGAQGEAYRVEIISSNGSLFKNGSVSTTLSARVYNNEIDITDSLNASCFKWTKINYDGSLDTNWNTKYFGGTKSVVITDTDVFGKASFKCEVDV